MLRRFVKTGIAWALHWTGTDRLIGRHLNGSGNTALVLGYHRVVENFSASKKTSIPAMLTSCRMLEQQLDWIGRTYDFVSLEELAVSLQEGRSFARPLASVTFDDGYRDVYENAFPLLRRKGIPGTIFVVTGLVGTSNMQVHDKLYLLLSCLSSRPGRTSRSLARLVSEAGVDVPHVAAINETPIDPLIATWTLLSALPQSGLLRVMRRIEDEVTIDERDLEMFRALTWDMIRKMYHQGFTIGSHTRSHVLLTNESPECARHQIEKSRLELQRELGTEIRHIAYPDGQFNAGTVKMVADAGYRFGYTTCRHRDPVYPLLTIPRMLLWENSCVDAFGHFSRAIMSCRLQWIFPSIDICNQDHGEPVAEHNPYEYDHTRMRSMARSRAEPL